MNSIIYRLIIKRRVNAAIYPKHYIRDAERVKGKTLCLGIDVF